MGVQWALLQPHFPTRSKLGRPPTDRRLVIDGSGFKVLPKRWVVERTFGWLMRHRRLVRDYEHCETSAEAWVISRMMPAFSKGVREKAHFMKLTDQTGSPGIP